MNMATEGCDLREGSDLPEAPEVLPGWVPDVIRQFMEHKSLANAASFKVFVRADHVEQFCNTIGDFNPIHLHTDAARERGFPERVVPAMLLAAFLVRSEEYQRLVQCGLRVLNLGASSTPVRPALVNTNVLVSVWLEDVGCTLDERLALTVGYRVASESGAKAFLFGRQKLSIQPK